MTDDNEITKDQLFEALSIMMGVSINARPQLDRMWGRHYIKAKQIYEAAKAEKELKSSQAK